MRMIKSVRSVLVAMLISVSAFGYAWTAHAYTVEFNLQELNDTPKQVVNYYTLPAKECVLYWFKRDIREEYYAYKTIPSPDGDILVMYLVNGALVYKETDGAWRLMAYRINSTIDDGEAIDIAVNGSPISLPRDFDETENDDSYNGYEGYDEAVEEEAAESVDYFSTLYTAKEQETVESWVSENSNYYSLRRAETDSGEYLVANCVKVDGSLMYKQDIYIYKLADSGWELCRDAAFEKKPLALVPFDSSLEDRMEAARIFMEQKVRVDLVDAVLDETNDSLKFIGEDGKTVLAEVPAGELVPLKAPEPLSSHSM